MTLNNSLPAALTTIRTARGAVPRMVKGFDMDSAVANIVACYDRATVIERVGGAAWYATARTEAVAVATATGLPLNQVVGVIASLSPSCKWSVNLADAAALCMAFHVGGVSAAGEVSCKTYGQMKSRAIKVLSMVAPSDSDVEAVVYGAQGRKIRSFYRCILSGGETDVCIDGHAFNIQANTRQSLKAVPGLSMGRYATLQVAYHRAAAARGLTASAMQAVTWVAWRREQGITD